MKYELLLFFGFCFFISGLFGIFKMDNLIEFIYVFLLFSIGILLISINFLEQEKEVEDKKKTSHGDKR